MTAMPEPCMQMPLTSETSRCDRQGVSDGGHDCPNAGVKAWRGDGLQAPDKHATGIKAFTLEPDI